MVGGGVVPVIGGRGVGVITMMSDDALVVMVGEGVEGEAGGVVVDVELSEVADEVLNVAFG